MFASYNNFSHNILRDATIISLLDTFTSLFSGIIIFGILGNLAYENGTDDIKAVVQGGSGLAFVSYPNAISKFDVVPQLFAVLFFFMLFVLGIGSNVGLATCLFTVLKDKFPTLKRWQIVIPLTMTEFLIGLMYTTPVSVLRRMDQTVRVKSIFVSRVVNIYSTWSTSLEFLLLCLLWESLNW